MALVKDWNHGGGALLPNGGERPGLRDILHPLTGLAALTDLKAIARDQRYANIAARVLADAKVWRWHDTSVVTADDLLVAAAADAPTAGRWLLEAGTDADLSLPITFNTADTAVLWTVPTGAVVRVIRHYWEVTVGWTGGASSAIGASSSATGHTTKGDLAGGAAGDVAATLVTGNYIEGTVGADIAAGVILTAGATVRFDRITSAFTAGAGNLHLLVHVIRNAGA